MEPADLKVVEERLNSLKTLIEARLDALNKVLELRDKALELQAKEYERRLSDLNGEHARLKEDRNTYLPREVYQNYIDDRRKWSDGINSTLAATAGQARGVDKTWTTVIALISAALSAVVTYMTTHRW